MTAATQTEMQSEVKAASQTKAGSARRLQVDWLYVACSFVAAGLLVVAFFLPLWTMDMDAPQYPQGLRLTAYGTKMTGDLGEINELNHYVGVKEIKPDSVTELKLFPYFLFGLVGVVIAGSFFLRGRLQRGALALVVASVPIGMLADVQWWLYSFGHDRSSDAPMKIADFTPRVLGGTQVVNFHTDTMVAVGWWLMVAAALLVSVVPPLFRFLWTSWNNTAEPAPAAG